MDRIQICCLLLALWADLAINLDTTITTLPSTTLTNSASTTTTSTTSTSTPVATTTTSASTTSKPSSTTTSASLAPTTSSTTTTATTSPRTSSTSTSTTTTSASQSSTTPKPTSSGGLIASIIATIMLVFLVLGISLYVLNKQGVLKRCWQRYVKRRVPFSPLEEDDFNMDL